MYANDGKEGSVWLTSPQLHHRNDGRCHQTVFKPLLRQLIKKVFGNPPDIGGIRGFALNVDRPQTKQEKKTETALCISCLSVYFVSTAV